VVVASLVAVVLTAALYVVAAPAAGRELFIDEVINRQTVDQMRTGDGYYEAMEGALRRNVGPASSVRAFRTPFAFLAWRWLPGAGGRWLAYVAVVVLVCGLLVSTTNAPWVAPIVALYLLRFGRPHYASGWIDQYLLVELWALPAVVGAIVAWRVGRTGVATGLAVVASAVRELAVLLVIGAVISAVLRRTPWRPAIVATATMALIFGVHGWLTSPHLADRGAEAALLGTGGIDRVFTMAAVGLPRPNLVGPLLWGVSWWWLIRQRDVRLFAAPLLALPLIGLFVGRDYWGLLVVPLELLAAGEMFVAASASMRRRTRASSPS
jgi:hypothetical protein